MSQITKELTVGIIGGMGPYATLEFFQSVLKHTPAEKDWEHLHVLIDNNPKIPSRTRAFLYNEADPVPMMVESANRLSDAGADFVVLPCNSAHYFLPRVRQCCKVNFIDMIDVTSLAVLALGSQTVGLLAGEVTVLGRLYEDRLCEKGVKVLQVTDEDQVVVREIIEDVKHAHVDTVTYDKMNRLIAGLKKRGADTIILGCTELPVVMPGVTVGCLIVDSVDVLAKAVVARAKQGCLV